MKQGFFSIFILFTVLFAGCDNTEKTSEDNKETKQVKFEGRALGTFYSISYFDEQGRNFQPQIDSLLSAFNKSLSTYDSTSVISKINRNIPVKPDYYFLVCFRKAIEISEKTGGAFDMTVAPLVNEWNFGFTKRSNPDSIDVTSINIDSLLVFIGYDKVYIENDSVIKKDPRVMLDASAIAKGYAVDVVGEFFEKNGIANYLVEIGGEIRARGIKPKGNKWKVAIDKPIDQNDKIIHERQAVVSVENKAIATSGNYRQFYEKDGVKYSHTIDPHSGKPVQHNLLSATVMTEDCMTADAYATAFMVMGWEKASDLLTRLGNVDAYLVYDDNGQIKVFETEGFKKVVIE